MLAHWSLRTRLVAFVAVVLSPVLALSAWDAVRETRLSEQRLGDAVAAAAERIAGRHKELIEGSRRLLMAICASSAVRTSANPDAPASDIRQCEAYLGQVVQMFPTEYSTAMVTDADGVARCSSLPTAVGMAFSDRQIFRMVRESRKFEIGGEVASRVTPKTIIPMAMPIIQAGEFRGMCAIGMSLSTIAELAVAGGERAGVAVSLVDRTGTSVGGSPEADRTLPLAPRLTAAIIGGQSAFSDYGQDGQRYDFRLLPLEGTTILVIAAAPLSGGIPTLIMNWGGFALIVIALCAALSAIWFGTDRWCVRPLRYIRDFADRVARGDNLEFAPARPWGPELASVGDGVKALAEAIAVREAELRAGLEQRDHMLREIHHRVKNNLQMISSLLNLQAGEIRSPRIRRFFGDAQNRVLTLSILHRHLYERSSWALVDFQQFISDLVRQISVGRRRADWPQPRYHIRAPIMAVGPDIAIPIGLIVTEAVGSALNRSLDGGGPVEINIEAADKDGMVELIIEDNGAGRTKVVDIRGGFGLTLIRGLAMQLGGEAQVSATEGGGMRVAVTFPMPDDQSSDG